MLHDSDGQALRTTEPVVDGLPNYFASIDFPSAHPRISVAAGETADFERLTEAAVTALAPARGMRQFVSAGDVVFIKPNVGFDRPPAWGATTHPAVLRALIRMCLQAGADEVLVADHPIESPEVCFARSGIGEAAVAAGASIVLPARSMFSTLVARAHRPDPSAAEALGRWPVFYKPLKRATKVIGVAPVKDHNLCGASMALKNWYGILGGPRNRFHQVIHGIISDLAWLISPTLTVADGTRVLMRNGPTGGRASDVRPGGCFGRPVVVASVDPVACDAWCFEKLLGRDPTQLAYLGLAKAKIAKEIDRGAHRFAESDWRVYARQGKVVTTGV